MSLVKPVHAGYFCGQSVTALAERLRAGGLTSVELTQAALDTIARLNPTLNAFVEDDAPDALRYGLMSRPSASKLPQADPAATWMFQQIFKSRPWGTRLGSEATHR